MIGIRYTIAMCMDFRGCGVGLIWGNAVLTLQLRLLPCCQGTLLCDISLIRTHNCSCIHGIKLNSYWNASVFLSLCRMRISVFWGRERLTDRSISKRYLKSDIATWVEKSLTSRVIHACDTGFYWSSENALHERFIASSGVGVWMKTLQLIAKRLKNASVLVWIQLKNQLGDVRLLLWLTNLQIRVLRDKVFGTPTLTL